jgi:penicillin-binding protein
MNAPITKLYALMLMLFAALVGFTSYWAVFDSNTLKDETANRRPLIEEQQVRRGFIKTADGATVAESHPEGGGKTPVYVRDYPQGSLYGHPVGYSFVQSGQTGIEKSENAELAGERNEFTSTSFAAFRRRARTSPSRSTRTSSRSRRRRCSRRSRATVFRAWAERWSRSTRPRGPSRRWSHSPVSTRTRSRIRTSSSGSTARGRERHS